MSLLPSPSGFPTSLKVPNIGGAVADAVTTSDKEHFDSLIKGKYKGVATYLRIIATTAKKEGIPPEFQAAIVAVENTGVNGPINWKHWNSRAKSGAGALGIAQFMPSTWAGSWNPWRNRSPLDAGVALQAQARFLKNLLREHRGNASEAAQSYNGGSTRNGQTAAYAAQMQRAMSELRTDKLFAGGGGFHLPNVIPDALDSIGDLTDGALSLVTTLLSPKKFGQLLAQVWAYVLRFLFRAIWDYAIAPLWHWNQRATGYYFNKVMSEPESSSYYYRTAGIVTVSFWSTWFAILWARDDGRALASDPQATPFGSFLRATRATNARRRLVKPSDVDEKTPLKPEPHESAAEIRQVDRVSVTRRRPVNVTKGEPSE